MNIDNLPPLKLEKTPSNWHEQQLRILFKEKQELEYQVRVFRKEYYRAALSLKGLDTTKLDLKQGEYVYVLRDPATQFYKFGRSANPVKRINEQRGGAPIAFEVVAIIAVNDMNESERGAHTRYADARKNGEWFAVSKAAVVEFVARYDEFYVFENVNVDTLMVIQGTGVR